MLRYTKICAYIIPAKILFFPQMNFWAEFIVIFAKMSDVSLSTEEISRSFTLILWIGWKKENHYGTKLIDFLFEAPDNSDIKLVSLCAKLFFC